MRSPTTLSMKPSAKNDLEWFEGSPFMPEKKELGPLREREKERERDRERDGFMRELEHCLCERDCLFERESGT